MKNIEEIYNKINKALYLFRNDTHGLKRIGKLADWPTVDNFFNQIDDIAGELKEHILEQERKPNQKWQKQEFDILLPDNTHKSVMGEVYDQYGIHKDDKEFKLTHIPTGMRIDNVPASHTSRKITKAFLKKIAEEIVENGYKLSGDTENDREENIKTRDFMIDFTRRYFDYK